MQPGPNDKEKKPETTKEKKPETAKEKKHETLDERVHRHLNDKNDIITEQDLKNIEVAGTTPLEKKQSEDMADEFSKKKQETPWDILDAEE